MRRANVQKELTLKKKVLSESDPLFGVLQESQVGINPANGRPCIEEEVLAEMRRYLLANTGEDLALKLDKVIRSVKEVEMDPAAQRIALRLEDPPVFTPDLNKGKCLVFDYGRKIEGNNHQIVPFKPEKLMASAIGAFSSPIWPDEGRDFGSESSESISKGNASEYPSVFKLGLYSTGSSGIRNNASKPRRRPSKAVRQARKGVIPAEVLQKLGSQREGKQAVGSKKRKCEVQEEGRRSTSKASCLEVIPHEGSPNAQ